MLSGYRHPVRRLLINTWRASTSPWRSVVRRRLAAQGRLPISVLFYHRVADDCPNPWTIPTGEFENQVTWLERHFEILPLEEVQRRVRETDSRTPAVAITFDDGYADNASFAIPLLIQRKIPFTYFVTTGNAVSGSPFPHDVARGEPLAPNSIDALRAMAAAGVEIGGHTRSHGDLAKLDSADQLFDEVVQASRDLGNLIGQEIRYFAFPFGQLDNMSAEAIAMAKQHGIRGICSAYGGYNLPGGNGLHLQRIHGDPDTASLKNWLTLDPRLWGRWSTDRAANLFARADALLADGYQRSGVNQGKAVWPTVTPETPLTNDPQSI